MTKEQARVYARKSLLAIERLRMALKDQIEFLGDLNEQENLGLSERIIGNMEQSVAFLEKARENIHEDFVKKGNYDID